jgi:hypothetical protein
MEQIMSLIYTLDFVVLIVLVAGLVWWQRIHGRLTANKFAALLTGYFSFLFVSTLSPLLITHTQVTLIVDIVFLAILWCIGFPWFRWIYSQFNSSK